EEEDNRQDNVNVIHLVEDDGKNITYSVDADSLKVKFEVIKDRCWVSVKEGNSVIFQGNLNSGETKEWETTDKLRIRIGNPPAVKVILNGNEIDISGDHPKNLIVMRKQ
ncbi:MAG: DUF4115 domain-containing protein, partial [Thermosediminibacteraceae bacterium]|nr:DUF4115 domain-containing protein [Thermosediminibacteraceae bacterium]